MLKSKMISLAVAASMAAMSLAGCGGNQSSETTSAAAAAESTTTADANTPSEPAKQDTSAAPAGEATTLKWAIWDINSIFYYQPLVEEFEKETGIKIELVDVGSAGTSDYVTNLAIELSGSGTDFDLATIQSVPQYSTLVSKGVLAKLDDFIAQDGWDLSQYKGLTDQLVVDGGLYELPFRSDFWLLFYNPDVFEAQGVAAPTNDMTWEQFDALAREVANPTPGQEIYGSHYHTWRSCVQCPAALDGKHTVLDGNYDFFKPFYDMVVAQMEDGISRNYAELKTSSLHHSDAFAQGNTAMYYMGSWQIQGFINKIKTGEYTEIPNWRLAKMPHAEGVAAGDTIGTVTGISIVEGSDKKAEAWEFLKFMSGPKGAALVAQTGSFPAVMTDEVIEEIAGMEGFPQDEQSKAALKTGKLYLEMPISPYTTDIETILNEQHDAIMTGAETVDDGIKAMNEQVSALMQ